MRRLVPFELTALTVVIAGCGGGSIELLVVQLEGKKRMPSAAFLNGFSLEPDEVLS